jgi:hypothetical protein
MEYGKLTDELCYQSQELILDQVVKTVKAMNAKSVFVATDSDDLIAIMSQELTEVW